MYMAISNASYDQQFDSIKELWSFQSMYHYSQETNIQTFKVFTLHMETKTIQTCNTFREATPFIWSFNVLHFVKMQALKFPI